MFRLHYLPSEKPRISLLSPEMDTLEEFYALQPKGIGLGNMEQSYKIFSKDTYFPGAYPSE